MAGAVVLAAGLPFLLAVRSKGREDAVVVVEDAAVGSLRRAAGPPLVVPVVLPLR